MKYITLLATSNILYHGTTSLNYDSIKKHGLTIRNQSFPSIGMRKNTIKPLGGIYLGSYDRALEYAKSQAKTHGGKPLIISVLVHYNKYCAIDDDIIIRMINQFIRKPCSTPKEAQTKVHLMLKSLFKISETIADMLIDYNELCKPFNYDKLSRMFGKLIPMMLNTRYSMFNPQNKLRYLKPIAFKGKTRILNMEVL